MEQQPMQKKAHSVLLENREKLTLTGVSDVECFSDGNLVIQTDYGQIDVRGENLQVTKLSLETGDLVAEGAVDSLNYTVSLKSGGLFSKVFR